VTSPAINHSWAPPFLEPVGWCRKIVTVIVNSGSELVKLYPARAQTALYRVAVARSIVDDAGKMDTMLTPGGRCFGFLYSLSQHCNARMGLPTLPSCYIVAIFLLLDVTVFCKPMNASEATRQLLRHLAFDLHNFGLSEIKLKLVIGLNYTVTRRS